MIEALQRQIKHLIHVHVWGMHIHPSARIAPSALMDRTFPRGVHVGADAVISEQAVVLTHDMTRGLYLNTYIGDRCHVGPRAIVLPGLTVGDDSVVAPGAVLTKDVPARSYASGNPAVITPREDQPNGGHPKTTAS